MYKNNVNDNKRLKRKLQYTEYRMNLLVTYFTFYFLIQFQISPKINFDVL